MGDAKDEQKTLKINKNHQSQFLRLRFEALDELDRLGIFPRPDLPPLRGIGANGMHRPI